MYNSEYNSFISRTGNIDLYYSLMNKNIIGCLYTNNRNLSTNIFICAIYSNSKETVEVLRKLGLHYLMRLFSNTLDAMIA